MRMMRCSKCGFPFWFARMYHWEENGTFTYRMQPDYRGVILYADLFTELFKLIEERLGFPISHIVFEAQRNAAKTAIENIIGGLPARLRHSMPTKQFVVRFFCRLSIWLGTSYARVVIYKTGKLGEAIIRNPYDRELMAALVLGAFEYLEDQPFQHRWKRLGEKDVVSISPAEGKPEVSERLEIVPEKMRPGNHALPLCPRCGVPRALAPLVWDEFAGTITDTHREERVIFMEGYTNKAIFREMEKELGEAVNPLIVEAGKAFALRHLEQLPGIRAGGDEGRAAAWRVFSEEAVTMLPAWGHGNPVEFEYGQEDGKVTVTVDNPYEERLVAGYLAAGFELVEGREGKVEWALTQPSRVVYTIG